MAHPRDLDVSRLPSSGFTVASPSWWGTLGFMVIEGSTLGLCAFTYAYLSRRAPLWPPSGTPLPSLAVGSIVAAALLLSLIPAVWLKRAATALERGAVVRMLLLSAAVEIVILILRGYELHALPTHWDTTAYGSALWFTIGFHTTLLVLDMGESLVFAALFLWGPVSERHYADVADSVWYWFFVSLIWLPLYFMLYVSPRLFR